MPIYEYRCESCGHTLDALQKISDDPLRACPACEEVALKRLISAPAFRLKGSGWYETDFKSDKERKRNLAESGEKSGDKSADKQGGEKSGNKNSDKPAEKSGGEKKAAGESKSETSKPDSKKSKGSGSEAA